MKDVLFQWDCFRLVILSRYKYERKHKCTFPAENALTQNWFGLVTNQQYQRVHKVHESS